MLQLLEALQQLLLRALAPFDFAPQPLVRAQELFGPLVNQALQVQVERMYLALGGPLGTQGGCELQDLPGEERFLQKEQPVGEAGVRRQSFEFTADEPGHENDVGRRVQFENLFGRPDPGWARRHVHVEENGRKGVPARHRSPHRLNGLGRLGPADRLEAESVEAGPAGWSAQALEFRRFGFQDGAVDIEDDRIVVDREDVEHVFRQEGGPIHFRVVSL